MKNEIELNNFGEFNKEEIKSEETELDLEIRLNRDEYNILKEREQVLSTTKQKLKKQIEVAKKMELDVKKKIEHVFNEL